MRNSAVCTTGQLSTWVACIMELRIGTVKTPFEAGFCGIVLRQDGNMRVTFLCDKEAGLRL